jgi:Zn-dependent M16 (insulinase) family peptidase
MSGKEIAKTAFEQVEKEAREKQIGTVKRIVEKTLEKIDKIGKEIKDLQEEKKILELDIDDLKAGKIDQICERQEKSEKAKQTSVVVIIKEKVIERQVPYSPWFWPYQVIWQDSIPLSTVDKFYVNGTTTQNLAYNAGGNSFSMNTISCSVAKDATAGTYSIGNHTVYLR